MQPALSPLGKEVNYTGRYDKNLLFPILRKTKRAEIGITGQLPFKGADIWNSYEMSWLNAKGKPEVAIAELVVPCESTYLVESKSLKLYLNSFNQTRFASAAEVRQLLAADLSAITESAVDVTITLARDFPNQAIAKLPGFCLDTLDIACDTYLTNPDFLTTSNDTIVTETVHSDLLRSNCLITNQPDWASVQITYTGKRIDHTGLLRYLVSFRNHNDFHEQCVEAIFVDIMRRCSPERLTVYARYTRRGGIDINPFRSTDDTYPGNVRLCRQ